MRGERRIILVLDALNQLTDADAAHQLGWLPVVFPPNVRVLVSSLAGDTLEAVRQRHWPELAVPLFGKADIAPADAAERFQTNPELADKAHCESLTVQAWAAFDEGAYDKAILHAEKFIAEFHEAALEMEKGLDRRKEPPPCGAVAEAIKQRILENSLLNDVATCLFIKGRSAESKGDKKAAIKAYSDATRLPHARCWDPRGSLFWSPAKLSSDRLGRIASPLEPPPPDDGGREPPDVHGERQGGGGSTDCAVFAPAQIPQGDAILIQVFAYATGNEAEAAARAKEFDETTVRRGITTLSIVIRRGQILRFHLYLHGIEVQDASRELTWQGTTASVQFGVTIPTSRPAGTLLGTVLVSTEGIPVGRIDFKLVIVSGRLSEAHGETTSVGQAAVKFRKAFVSYASQDRHEVLRRVAMLRSPLTDIEVFQDILDLEPGALYEAILYRRIDECDIFLLFWSSNARKSEWVQNEIQHARDRQGPNGEPPPTILPVIIEGPPPPVPPLALAHLHFNDYLLYLAGPTPSPSGRKWWKFWNW